MRCGRCLGLMVEECAFAAEEAVLFFHAWRCLNCGDRLDDTILKNRQRPLTTCRPLHRRGSIQAPIAVRLQMR